MSEYAPQWEDGPLRMLVVEDNTVLADGVSRVMRDAGHSVDVAADGESALAALAAGAFDLVLLDLSLPDIDGLQLLKTIRGRNLDTAVIVLTARGALDEKVRGLDLGADDYVTKPFEVSELEARVRVALRNLAGQRKSEIALGPVTFDVNGRSVVFAGSPIEFPKRELNVFEMLALRPGKVISKQQLRESLAAFDEDISDNAIEQYVSRVRRRIEPTGLRILTARGLGYTLQVDEGDVP